MKNLIYILSIIVLLCSCKKEFNDFPVTLYADKVTYTSDVRLFVGQTKVTDKAIINKFIRNNAEQFQLSNYVISTYGTMHFNSKDSVTFFTESSKYSVKKEDSQFLFYSSLPFPVELSLPGGLRSPRMILPFRKYTDELILIGTSYFTKEVGVGYGSYTNLEMSFMAYKIVKTLAGTHMESGTINNEFYEEATSTLQPTDTLAIMEYRVKFAAK